MIRTLSLLSCMALAGCAAPAIEVANVARDRIVYQNNIAAAEAGNAEAQYRVGNALCCSVGSGQPFYNTDQAKDWLCRSAEQGYAPAMMRLGRIYNGELTDGVRAIRRAINASSTNVESPAIAWAWFSFAADAGASEGSSRASDLFQAMSQAQRAEGDRIRRDGRAGAPCRATTT